MNNSSAVIYLRGSGGGGVTSNVIPSGKEERKATCTILISGEKNRSPGIARSSRWCSLRESVFRASKEQNRRRRIIDSRKAGSELTQTYCRFASTSTYVATPTRPIARILDRVPRSLTTLCYLGPVSCGLSAFLYNAPFFYTANSEVLGEKLAGESDERLLESRAKSSSQREKKKKPQPSHGKKCFLSYGNFQTKRFE